MPGNPRVLFAAGAVAAAALAGVALALTTGGSEDEDAAGRTPRIVRAQLVIEQFPRPDTGARELLVSLSQPELNTLAVTGGERAVLLRCVDRDGAQALRRPVEWPLLEETGYPPHTHQPVDRRVLGRIRACRMTGPGIDFEARVPGQPPLAE